MAGTGAVRLYVGAHQGNHSGPNTTITLVADETVTQLPPGAPSDPIPADAATDQPLEVNLWWLADQSTDYCEVYFGTEDPPVLFANNVGGESYLVSDLEPSTTYYWMVSAVNEGGTTPSRVWSFTTETASAAENTLIASEFQVSRPTPTPLTDSFA